MTWDYAFTPTRTVDGDTVDGVVDLGFHMSALLRFRILSLDTPERGERGWAEATTITKAWLFRDNLRARTYKADSFGRWLADIYTYDDASGYSTLSNHVIRQMWDQHGIDCTWKGKP